MSSDHPVVTRLHEYMRKWMQGMQFGLGVLSKYTVRDVAVGGEPAERIEVSLKPGEHVSDGHKGALYAHSWRVCGENSELGEEWEYELP
jgi:hypothetical protein